MSRSRSTRREIARRCGMRTVADEHGVVDARRVLAHCKWVLLDVSGTFMFDHDRLNRHQDFSATYARLGGNCLEPAVVDRIVSAFVDALTARYDDPAHVDAFPSVAEVLDELPECCGVRAAERARLVDVVASHECGQIREEYALVIRELAHHRLSLGRTSGHRNGDGVRSSPAPS